MKKVFVLTMFSFFIVASNVAAVDFISQWEGFMDCSNDLADDPPKYIKFEITKKGNFITSLNITPTTGEKCIGVLEGNKISMTCESGNFAYGELKGKNIYFINHIPPDDVKCKGTASLIGYQLSYFFGVRSGYELNEADGKK
jgi:hypothetical protein